MFLVTVSWFLLIAGANAAEPKNAYEKFLSPDHNKTNIMWYFSQLDGYKKIKACENKTILEYRENEREAIVIETAINDDLMCIDGLIDKRVPIRNREEMAIPTRNITRNERPSISKMLKKDPVSSNLESTFCNWANDTERLQTASVTWEEEQTIYWSITAGIHMTSMMKIGIPQVSSTEIKFWFFLNTTLGSHYSVKKKVVRPPQTIVVAPHSCVEMWRILYKTKTLITYGLDFEVEDYVDNLDCHGVRWHCINAWRFEYIKIAMGSDGIRDVHMHNNATGTGMNIYPFESDRKTVIYNVPAQEIVDGFSDEIFYKKKPLPA